MEMVAQNRLAQEINPKVPSLMNRLLVDPGFSMIKILAAERIIPQEKAAANRAVHHMHNGNLIRCKHPQHEPTEPCVTSSPTANRLKQTAEVYKTKSGIQQCAVSPCSPPVFSARVLRPDVVGVSHSVASVRYFVIVSKYAVLLSTSTYNHMCMLFSGLDEFRYTFESIGIVRKSYQSGYSAPKIPNELR